MATSHDIATYLRSLPHVHDVVPCIVTIGRVTYQGARYMQILTTSPGSDAYRRGEREYTQDLIYLAGMLPGRYLRGRYLRSSPLALTMQGDSREWYVAGYYGEVVKRRRVIAESSEYHPFGNSILLAPWEVPDGMAIDHYESSPYRRVAASVIEQGV